MKLTRIQVAQWRQFRTPFTLDDLQTGINLFVGPNESGKSTLVEAVQAAFFERHKSGTVRHFQPHDDSGAEPSVSLSFEWQGQTWQLDKRFLGHARCNVTVDGAVSSGDAAEELLARLMGHTILSRGPSKPEHHGIPGLLWVQQGTIHNLRDPVAFAAEHLQTALGQDLGTVTSSDDWVLAEVTAQRARLLTPTGKPTGAYRQTATELDARVAELAQLDAQICAYEERVDTLARQLVEQDQIDRSRPWESQRREADAAQARLAQVRQVQAQLEQAQREHEHCLAQQKLLQDQLQGFENTHAQLQARDAVRRQAQDAAAALSLRCEAAEAQQRAAKARHESAETRFQQARQQAQRQRLMDEHQRLEADLARNGRHLTTLQQLGQELRALNLRLEQNAVDPVALKRLHGVQKALDDITLRKQSAATRLRWALQDDRSLDLDGQPLTTRGEQLLLQTATLTIPGIGALHISPGGKDAGELAREEVRLGGDRSALLAGLGVQSLAEAQERASTCAHTQAEIRHVETRIRDLAPDGIDAFARQIDADQARRDALATQIAACPPPQTDTPDEAQAGQARDAASAALAAADQALQTCRERLGLAQQAFETAQAEWQRLNDAAHDAERQEHLQAARRALTDQHARAQALRTDIAQRQAHIAQANPSVLQDDIERLGKSADALQEQANQRAQRIIRLQAELETLGAQGLEERRGALRETVEALQRRHAQLAAHANALDLLLTLLNEERQTLARQLQAPLQKHLTHYLQLLFPGAEIHVDDQLVPTVLQRASQHSAFDDLSYGAREQLGLISRLAYADLLREAGRPTLIILDDALVHSDVQRLGRMKRILYDAARRHQILLFSCHPANWTDLGVPARDLTAMAANETT